MAETVKLINRDLSKMYGALVMLGNRRMGNLGADLKVARLLRAVEPAVNDLNDQKNRALTDLLDGRSLETMTPEQRQQFDFRRSEQLAEFEVMEVVLDLPMAYALKEIDLPKEQSGAEGWRNAANIGAIVCDLGSLFLLEEPNGKCPACGKATE